LTAANQSRLRKAAIAVAVVLVHVLAVRGLLELRDILTRSADQPPAPAMTWILLQPSASTPKARNDASVAPMPMQAFPSQGVPELGSSSTVTVLQPIIPALTMPLAGTAINPDARVFTALGNYFACSVLDDAKRTNDERERCFSQLSGLRDIVPFQGAYAESKTTPFKLFGANGTFAFTPPSVASFDLVDASTGCTTRDHGLCGSWQPEKLGFDPGDPRRGSAVAHFELAKGLSIDAGAQAWMQNYLGGGRLALAAGVAISYRW
jgi:hypothetical protein